MQLRRGMWGALGAGALAVVAGGAAAIAAGPTTLNPETAKGPSIAATEQGQGGSASPQALVGLWRTSASSIAACSERPSTATTPDQDDMTLLHGDGSVTQLFGTQSFGAFPNMPTNAIGALGSWSIAGRDVRIRVTRYLFVPKDPENRLNTQVLLGYNVLDIRGTLTDENTITGTAEISAVSTSTDACSAIGKSTPCLLRCYTGTTRMTRSDPFPIPAP